MLASYLVAVALLWTLPVSSTPVTLYDVSLALVPTPTQLSGIILPEQATLSLSAGGTDAAHATTYVAVIGPANSASAVQTVNGLPVTFPTITETFIEGPTGLVQYETLLPSVTLALSCHWATARLGAAAPCGIAVEAGGTTAATTSFTGTLTPLTTLGAGPSFVIASAVSASARSPTGGAGALRGSGVAVAGVAGLVVFALQSVV
ncbi:unnamed protein product [Mycena citricolor]|uniref:Uncharacterized protein n=1 Tax=Mycena citricolor TaxID=2018698 RepID=A0AAD2HXN4_9AGAR|nr:unnamed protein product [Mycena citricolor]